MTKGNSVSVSVHSYSNVRENCGWALRSYTEKKRNIKEPCASVTFYSGFNLLQLKARFLSYYQCMVELIYHEDIFHDAFSFFYPVPVIIGLTVCFG